MNSQAANPGISTFVNLAGSIVAAMLEDAHKDDPHLARSLARAIADGESRLVLAFDPATDGGDPMLRLEVRSADYLACEAIVGALTLKRVGLT